MRISTPTPVRPRWARIASVALGLTPLAFVHLALLALPFLDFSWRYLAGAAAVILAVGLSINVGFHRGLSHRSYKTSRPVQFLLAATACAAFQRGPLWWVIHHRLHHRHSDTPHDPHSPVVDGFLYSYIGWLVVQDLSRPDRRVVRDLAKYPELVWLDRLWVVPGILLAAACFALGGWGGLVYAFCAPVAVLFQAAFAVNSIGHLFGSKRFQTGDGSRNNLFLGYAAFGEGWHNNHHRAPYSARHGFAWYEFDLSYLCIRLLALFRLAWGVKVPSPELMAGCDTRALANEPAVTPPEGSAAEKPTTAI